MGFCRKLYKRYYVDVVVFRGGNVLQRLGKVINVTPSQNIVVKVDKAPKVGSSVVDGDLRAVGRIFDVVGPVASPYAIVKASIQHPEKLANQQLYTAPSERKRSQR